MKIIIYVNYSSKEFNKDFDYANMLIENEHNVLMVSNDKQLYSAIDYYDVLIYGFSYSGQPLALSMNSFNFNDFLNKLNL